MRLPRLAPLALVLVLGASALPLVGGEAAPAVPAPVAIVDQDTFVLLVIPNLLATLERVEKMAAVIAPGQLPEGMLKLQLGQAISDAGLSNLDAKPILLAVGKGMPYPNWALVIPAKNAQVYADAAAVYGMMSKVVGNLVVVSQLPTGLEMGERLAAGYADLAKVPTTVDVRLLAAPERIVTAYGGFLTGIVQMGVAQMAQQPGQEMAAKMLPLEVAGLLAMYGDLSGVQVDVGLSPEALVITTLAAAKPESALAKALVAPAALKGPTAASRMGADPGVVAISGRLNLQAAVTYFADLLTKLQARPEGKELLTPALIDQVKSWGAPFTGDLAFRTRSTAEIPMLSEGLYGCADAAKAEALLDGVMQQMFTGDGPIAKAYRDMGMGVKLDKKVRTVAGVPVHRVSYVLDESKMPPVQVAQMKKVMRDSELAFAKDWCVFSQDAKSLDALVAGAGPALVTRAEKAIGAGRDGYVDVDVIGLVRMASQFVGGIAPPNVIETMSQLKPSEPLVSAWTVVEGRARTECRVPSKPFADLVKAFAPPATGTRQEF